METQHGVYLLDARGHVVWQEVKGGAFPRRCLAAGAIPAAFWRERRHWNSSLKAASYSTHPRQKEPSPSMNSSAKATALLLSAGMLLSASTQRARPRGAIHNESVGARPSGGRSG
jgi:hypothetical protein